MPVNRDSSLGCTAYFLPCIVSGGWGEEFIFLFVLILVASACSLFDFLCSCYLDLLVLEVGGRKLEKERAEQEHSTSQP